MKYPTITALMVTMGRLPLVRESYKFFTKQTYPEKRLLIVTDCAQKEHEALKKLAHEDKRVLIAHVEGRLSLGELRNISLEYSTSDLTIQWDDDDWYGPTRIMEQWNGLKSSKAVMLQQQLHYFRDSSKVALTCDPTGIEGTLLMDRRCGLTYPSQKKGEDTVLKKELKERNWLNLVTGGVCYCRTYHGSNTWDKGHHLERVKNFKKPITKKELKDAERIYAKHMVEMSSV